MQLRQAEMQRKDILKKEKKKAAEIKAYGSSDWLEIEMVRYIWT